MPRALRVLIGGYRATMRTVPAWILNIIRRVFASYWARFRRASILGKVVLLVAGLLVLCCPCGMFYEIVGPVTPTPATVTDVPAETAPVPSQVVHSPSPTEVHAQESAPLVNLTGHVYLQGRANHAGITVRVAELSATTAEDGAFAISNIETGIHTVEAFRPGFLRAEKTTLRVEASEQITLPDVTLPGGDVDEDGDIDLFDQVAIGAVFGQCPPPDPRTDLTGDGCVNVFDYVILGGNYNLTGPIAWGEEIAQAPSPTDTTRPVHTVAPTSTPVGAGTPIPPTDSPTNTVTPTDTRPPPTPTNTQTPVTSKGIGVPRKNVQKTMELLGFSFVAGEPVGGQPNVVGMSSLASVQLIGPADNLTNVSIWFGLTTDEQKNETISTYVLLFLQASVPSWKEGLQWVADNLVRATQDGAVTTTHNGLRIRLMGYKELSIALVEITNAEAPIITAEAATITPLPADLPSGSLGLDRAEWEQLHKVSRSGSILTEYDDGRFQVGFSGDKVFILDQRFVVDRTLEAARLETEPLMPADSVLVKSYRPEGLPMLTVDLYYSEWLKQRFDAEQFIGGDPGQFIAMYDILDGRVPSVIMGLGNNP